ncbi:uroporphyrinogen-III synthase [Oceanobacillus jeddahense]|uniref:Uroporphyrinogen-III synthase n=1 Tax=Oceanobacillus jeddahense TaxID=1462527 RepID=A0ABY5JZV4_9BACI|nr:uroporphyrinogen-III synthase [Oceanobacillus jeddahense]UUI05320.1 uroporphyrinogen-III synthase [Oceanobacillus jeddahense]
MGKSLNGERILITREATKAGEMAEKVTKLGGSPIVVPMIEINFDESPENQTIIERLSDFSWVLITSANGVHGFFQLLNKHHIQLPQALNIGVVGKKTEGILETYGYTASFVPETFDALTMTDEFFFRYKRDKPVLLIRGNLSRPTLPKKLQEAQIPFETLEVYETMYSTESKAVLNQVLPTINYITFTSPSTVDAFIALAKYVPDKAAYICIGRTTEEKAQELGVPNLYTSTPYTTDAMLDLIVKIANERKINHE